MNELTTVFDRHPGWIRDFSEVDRLLVETMVRGVSWDDDKVRTELDDDGVEFLLAVARSVRLDHVALDLAEVSSNGDRSFESMIERLSHATSDPHVGPFCDVIDIDAPVTPSGPPIVIARIAGRARYAYLRRFAYAENRVARVILAAVESAQPGVAIDNDDETQRVIGSVLTQRITIVTGGPGTGKTTLIGRVLAELGKQRHRDGHENLVVALCAPTAKAAVRLRDAIATSGAGDLGWTLHERSGSVHRLLQIRPDRATVPNIVDCDVIVIDEASMLELTLWDLLLAHSRPTTRFVIAGDADQLASVNVGAVLRDLVDAGGDNDVLTPLVTRLRTNYRSSDAIVAAAAAINRGDIAALETVSAQHPLEIVLTTERSAAVEQQKTHTQKVRRLVEGGNVDEALREMATSTVLCAARHGLGSVAWWRQQLSEPARSVAVNANAVTLGSPILVTKNEPLRANDEPRLSNGDVGIVSDVSDGIVISFLIENQRVVRSLASLGEVETAHALTIHKSQGSEFDHVVVSLPSGDSPLLTRELLYTAVTRARLSVTIIGSPEIIAATLARRVARVSGLTERVRALGFALSNQTN